MMTNLMVNPHEAFDCKIIHQMVVPDNASRIAAAVEEMLDKKSRNDTKEIKAEGLMPPA